MLRGFTHRPWGEGVEQLVPQRPRDQVGALSQVEQRAWEREVHWVRLPCSLGKGANKRTAGGFVRVPKCSKGPDRVDVVRWATKGTSGLPSQVQNRPCMRVDKCWCGAAWPVWRCNPQFASLLSGALTIHAP